MLGLIMGNSDIECWEDMVRLELLLDRVLDGLRSWLCLRASGTGGGIRFWGGEV